MVGILDDVSKAVPSAFQRAGDAIVLLTLPVGTQGHSPMQEFGSSEYAKLLLGAQWGTPPFMQLLEEHELHNALVALSKKGLIHSACDVSDGGIVVALAKACLVNNVGAQIYLHEPLWGEARELFGEDSSLVLITCSHDALLTVRQAVDDCGFVFPQHIGSTVSTNQVDHDPDFEITFGTRAPSISTSVSKLRAAYSNALEFQLAEEVLA